MRKRQLEAAAREQQMKQLSEVERLKDFSLEVLGEDGVYRTITLEEFQKFAKEEPELAKYFYDPENEIPKIPVPDVDPSVRIYHHWEKVCMRMLKKLNEGQDAWIFKDPVDEKKLGIADYFTIIKNPMDFGTMREKLKNHEYLCIEDFVRDIHLTFSNCMKYNGVESRVGEMCRNVQHDFKHHFVQLNFRFYITEPDFEDEALLDLP